jgi:hypothetical protein
MISQTVAVDIHTLTEILVVSADSISVIDEWSFSIEVRAWSVGQCLVIQVEQLAVVRSTDRRASVKKRSAQELIFYLAGKLARRLTGHLSVNSLISDSGQCAVI